MAIHENLWQIIEDQFPMGKESHHGPRHWRRVLLFGERLTPATGADPELVELFAVFHDSRRLNDAVDAGHGERGAELAKVFRDQLFTIDDGAMELLLRACKDHTSGELSSDPTIATCWDADRLDLWRVGIYPQIKYLCTEEARETEIIEWAVRQSVRSGD